MTSSNLRIALLAGASAIIAICATNVGAAVPGVYVGGEIGRGQVDQNVFGYALPGRQSVGGFDEETSYQALIGIRPIPYLGLEVSYVDFGQAAQGLYQLKLEGPAAAVMGYIPVGPVDLFGKAGVARLSQSFEVQGKCPVGFTCFVGPQQIVGADTDTGFVGGAGAQFKIGHLALRAEYDRFTVTGGHPHLAMIGAIWTF